MAKTRWKRRELSLAFLSYVSASCKKYIFVFLSTTCLTCISVINDSLCLSHGNTRRLAKMTDAPENVNGFTHLSMLFAIWPDGFILDQKHELCTRTRLVYKNWMDYIIACICAKQWHYRFQRADRGFSKFSCQIPQSMWFPEWPNTDWAISENKPCCVWDLSKYFLLRITLFEMDLSDDFDIETALNIVKNVITGSWLRQTSIIVFEYL